MIMIIIIMEVLVFSFCNSYFSDSSTVMFTVFLLFVTPANACFSLKGQKKFSFGMCNCRSSIQ